MIVYIVKTHVLHHDHLMTKQEHIDKLAGLIDVFEHASRRFEELANDGRIEDISDKQIITT